MVMRPEPWGDALDDLLADAGDRDAGERPLLLVPTPGRAPFDQPCAEELAASPGWSSRAAGTRASTRGSSTTPASRMRVDEVSIGDYVLAGGEAAALVVVEAVTRLLPGVLGNAESLVEESHVDGAAGVPRLHQAARAGAGSTSRGPASAATTARSRAGDATQALRRTAQRRPDLVRVARPGACATPTVRCWPRLGWVADGSGGFSPPDGAVPD